VLHLCAGGTRSLAGKAALMCRNFFLTNTPFVQGGLS
jgi:hypothetical protein